MVTIPGEDEKIPREEHEQRVEKRKIDKTPDIV